MRYRGKELATLGLGCLENRLVSHGIIPLDNYSLPTFIGIGTPQSGTTWLYTALKAHPDVYVSKKKELQFFSQKYYKGLSWYSRQFKAAGTRVRGEISPNYAITSIDQIKLMHAFVPDIRLILLIRDPVDQTWSAARRSFQRLYPDDPHLDAIPEEEWFAFFDNYPDYKAKELKRYVPDEPGFKHAHYSRIIDRWTTIFDPEQLYLGFFDDVHNDPKSLLTEVCDHIGVRAGFEWNQVAIDKKINKNPSKEIPARFVHYLEDLYKDELDRLERVWPDRVAVWRKRHRSLEAVGE